MASNIHTGPSFYGAYVLVTDPTEVVIHGRLRDCRGAINGLPGNDYALRVSEHRSPDAALRSARREARQRSLPCKSVPEYFAEGGKDGGP